MLNTKERFIKKYDLLGENIKETNEFSKKSFEDLIKNVDAILEKTSYYSNLIEGAYTEEAKEKLNEMESKVKLYLEEMLKFMD